MCTGSCAGVICESPGNCQEPIGVCDCGVCVYTNQPNGTICTKNGNDGSCVDGSCGKVIHLLLDSIALLTVGLATVTSVNNNGPCATTGECPDTLCTTPGQCEVLDGASCSCKSDVEECNYEAAEDGIACTADGNVPGECNSGQCQ